MEWQDLFVKIILFVMFKSSLVVFVTFIATLFFFLILDVFVSTWNYLFFNNRLYIEKAMIEILFNRINRCIFLSLLLWSNITWLSYVCWTVSTIWNLTSEEKNIMDKKKEAGRKNTRCIYKTFSLFFVLTDSD